MTLVVLYGAPGAGKLTTARALGALTGFKVFHNHLSFDLVKAVFDFPTPPFLELMERIRLATFEAAAREGVSGIVFTFVYAAPEDDALVKRMIDAVEGAGGTIRFVRLFCDTATNERRVAAPDRARFGKVATVESFRRILAQATLTAPIPFRPSLEIDNSAVDPDTVARRVAARLGLPRRDFTIRPARLDDAPAIHALHTASVRALCAGHYAPEVIDGWLANRAPAGYLDSIARGVLFVAEHDGTLLAFGEADPGLVRAIYVDPAAVQRGVGRAILRQAVTQARRGHAGPIRLEATLNARPFYERAGFRAREATTVTRSQVQIPVIVMEYDGGSTVSQGGEPCSIS